MVALVELHVGVEAARRRRRPGGAAARPAARRCRRAAAARVTGSGASGSRRCTTSASSSPSAVRPRSADLAQRPLRIRDQPGLGLHDHRGDVVADHVVQLAGQAGALLEPGRLAAPARRVSPASSSVRSATAPGCPRAPPSATARNGAGPGRVRRTRTSATTDPTRPPTQPATGSLAAVLDDRDVDQDRDHRPQEGRVRRPARDDPGTDGEEAIATSVARTRATPARRPIATGTRPAASRLAEGAISETSRARRRQRPDEDPTQPARDRSPAVVTSTRTRLIALASTSLGRRSRCPGSGAKSVPGYRAARHRGRSGTRRPAGDRETP